jgi:hypothetical protein
MPPPCSARDNARLMFKKVLALTDGDDPYRERGLIVEAVRATAGVRGIIDNLKVR